MFVVTLSKLYFTNVVCRILHTTFVKLFWNLNCRQTCLKTAKPLKSSLYVIIHLSKIDFEM